MIERSGKLLVVGTPIGNLGDLSPRAARALGQADLVAAEDTRTARALLSHLALHKPTVSYFDGNEARRSGDLLRQLCEGKIVALISESGMPLVSDPGFRLVRACAGAGVTVEVVPGPSAALVALVGSGLPTDQFRFLGFLPRKP
ncbi:MAG: ribosomal RNA small subunit methyltransferase I, partial [Myxococcota bacterium]